MDLEISFKKLEDAYWVRSNSFWVYNELLRDRLTSHTPQGFFFRKDKITSGYFQIIKDRSHGLAVLEFKIVDEMHGPAKKALYQAICKNSHAWQLENRIVDDAELFPRISEGFFNFLNNKELLCGEIF